MNILDALKKGVLEQFDTSISITGIILSLVVAFLISILIIVVYRKTFSGVVYNRSTTLTIILLALATSMIIRTINSNLSLSLGMVGALSIVRFRTAIKDPVDTAFLFWAITAGIMSGAGLYFFAIIGSLLIALLYYLSYFYTIKAKKKFLLVVSYEQAQAEAVASTLSTYSKKQLKSKSLAGNDLEETYQVEEGTELDSLMNKLNAIENIKGVNLVSYNNDFGL